MPLSTNLPVGLVAGDPDHTDGHNTTNGRVNEVAAAVNTDVAALASHTAATTSVHGITNTAALATTSSVTTAISTHTAATDPHGDRAAAATALASHEADTTSVHGIANTAVLVTTTVTNALDTRLDTVEARPRTLTPTEFGAVGDGSTDDAAALAATLAALNPGDTLLLPGGTVFAHSTVLVVDTPGVTVRGGGTLRATTQATSAVQITADGVTVEDVTFELVGRTTRGSTLAHHKLLLDQCARTVLRRVTISDSHAAGIFVYGATDYLIDSPVVTNTAADGIHNTSASTRGLILNPRCTDTGDDGVAVVSYDADPAACQDIQVVGAVVRNPAARGLAIIGGTQIRYSDFEVVESAAAGIIVATEATFLTRNVADVVIERGRLVGCNTAGATIEHGSLAVIADHTGSSISDVVVRDLTIRDTDTSAPVHIQVSAYNGTITTTRLEDVRIVGTGPTGSIGTTNVTAADCKVVRLLRGDASQGWELLGEYTSAAGFATSGAITIEQRDMLMIVVRILGQSGAARPALRFNGDTGANYWNRYTLLTGAYTELNGAGTVALLSNITTAAVRTIEATVANNATGWQKAVTVKQAMAAPAGDPEVGHTEWSNTAAPITSVTLLNDGSGVTFGAHSGIMIFGRNFA